MAAGKNFNNFIASSSGQIITLICQLVIIKILTNRLSLEEFGLFSLILVIPTLILPIVFCEVITAFSRYFFEDSKSNLYLHCVIYLIAAFLILSLLVFALQTPLESLLDHLDIKAGISLLLLALSNHLFIYLGSLNLTYFKLNYSTNWYLLHCLITHLPKAVCLFVFRDQMDLVDIFIIFNVFHAAGFFISAFAIIKWNGFKWQTNTLKKLLSYSFWLIPGSYFGSIITSIDRIFIKIFISSSAVGLYSMGYKIADLIRQFFITSFSAVLSPIKFNTQTPANTYQNQMNLTMQVYLLVGFIACLGINALSKPLILILSNSDYLSAYILIPFILVAHLTWGLNDFLNTGYLLKNKTKITSLVLMIGAITNVCLNLLLIPKFGLVGACLSTAMSYLVTLPVSHLCSKKHHPLRLQLHKLLWPLFIFIPSLTVQSYLNSTNFSLVQVVIYNLSITAIFVTIVYIGLDKDLKNLIASTLKRPNDQRRS